MRRQASLMKCTCKEKKGNAQGGSSLVPASRDASAPPRGVRAPRRAWLRNRLRIAGSRCRRRSCCGVLGRHGGRKGLGRNREEERQWTTLPDDAARGRRCLGRRSRLLRDLIGSWAACRLGSGAVCAPAGRSRTTDVRVALSGGFWENPGCVSWYPTRRGTKRPHGMANSLGSSRPITASSRASLAASCKRCSLIRRCTSVSASGSEC